MSLFDFDMCNYLPKYGSTKKRERKIRLERFLRSVSRRRVEKSPSSERRHLELGSPLSWS